MCERVCICVCGLPSLGQLAAVSVYTCVAV